MGISYKNMYTKIQNQTSKITRTLSIMTLAIAGVGLIMGFMPVMVSAAPNAIYNNIPSPQPGNVPSQAFEATSTSEYGGQVSYAGTATDPTVTVLMSSWGCQNGSWYTFDCVTTPGSTFSEPITLNVYNVGAGNSVGSLVTSVTQTFNIPYRPSADNVNCTGPNTGSGYTGSGPNGEWYSASDNKCYNGFATPVVFNVSGTLPSNVIVSVAYNTSDYGYSPYGTSTACHGSSGGCGYDSLNVGLAYPPSTGTVPNPADGYLNSTWTGAYCDNGASGTGLFRLDSGCWTGYQPAIKIEVNPSGKSLGSVTGGLTLSNPHQQISFNAFDYGPNSASDYGNVEYQNFDYPGGLHYTANVSCVWVSGNDARFMFQIPAGYPGLSGLYVVASVHDGGSPGTKDTYGHTATANLATALNWCNNGVSVQNFTITGGNAVVHKN